jgi:hypothetical protein
VAFSRTADQLVVSLGWDGPAEDSSIALMWGDSDSETFRRGGCFAACHRDQPGMHGSGGVPQAAAAGGFLEIWRLRLGSGQLETTALLSGLQWQPTNLIQINESHKEGRWTVELVSPLNNTELMKPFSPEGKYTFGVALNGAGNPGGRHWVSLPVTLSFTGDETDFKVEQ